MTDVYVNGVRQIPGIDYTVSSNSIAFSMPPDMGSDIEINSRNRHLARIMGDGQTFLFQFFTDFDHEQTQMLEEAFKLRHVPAVADALERLQVVVELAKQEQ